MKRYLVIVLTLILAITMLTSCGSEPESAGETSGFDPSTITTFGDIYNVIDAENSQEAYTEHKYVYAFPVGEKDFYRAEADLTDELSEAIWAISFEDEERDAKIKDIMSSVEIGSLVNLAEGAPDQAYLDSLIGKTGGELFDEGFEYSYYDLSNMEVGFDQGVYSYVVTFDYDGEQMENTDDFDFYEEFKDLTVKTATYSGVGHATYIEEVEG